MSIRITGGFVNGPDFYNRAENAAKRASKVMFDELFARYQAAIGSKAWDWPNITKRSNGKTVSSPRDIVDTGTLRASGSRQMINDYQCEFSWRTNYALAVHEGARLLNGGFIPPRPWTDVVNGTVEGAANIKPYPAAERLEQLWKAFFDGQG